MNTSSFFTQIPNSDDCEIYIFALSLLAKIKLQENE